MRTEFENEYDRKLYLFALEVQKMRTAQKNYYKTVKKARDARPTATAQDVQAALVESKKLESIIDRLYEKVINTQQEIKLPDNG